MEAIAAVQMSWKNVSLLGPGAAGWERIAGRETDHIRRCYIVQHRRHPALPLGGYRDVQHALAAVIGFFEGQIADVVFDTVL